MDVTTTPRRTSTPRVSNPAIASGKCVLAGRPREEMLAQHRAVVGFLGFVAEQGGRGAVAEAGQRVRRRGSSRASADDDDASQVCLRLDLEGREPPADMDHAVPLGHAPAVERTQSGGREGRAGGRIETGVVPGAAQRAARQDALHQRRSLVRAGRSHGPNAIGHADQKDRIALALPGDQAGRLEIPDRHAKAKVAILLVVRHR